MARRPRTLQLLDAVCRIEHYIRNLARHEANVAHRLHAMDRRLTGIEAALQINTVNDILTRETLMATKEDLLAAVAANTEVDQSIVAALDANTELLREALADNGVDQSVIDDVVAQLTADQQAVADAVVRNTIADPGQDEIPGGNVPDDGTGAPTDDGTTEPAPVDDSTTTDQP
jgi:hypothetical protein